MPQSAETMQRYVPDLSGERFASDSVLVVVPLVSSGLPCVILLEIMGGFGFPFTMISMLLQHYGISAAGANVMITCAMFAHF